MSRWSGSGGDPTPPTSALGADLHLKTPQHRAWPWPGFTNPSWSLAVLHRSAIKLGYFCRAQHSPSTPCTRDPPQDPSSTLGSGGEGGGSHGKCV